MNISKLTNDLFKRIYQNNMYKGMDISKGKNQGQELQGDYIN